MRILFLLMLMAAGTVGRAQELNCTVSVISPQLQNVEKRILETMQNDIREFLNSTRWTNDNFKMEERIECSILITFSERIGNDRYRGTIQVQASRPSFNASYNSTMFNIMDQDFTVVYLESQQLQFQENQHISNLTSVLAYYANLIIGMDYDSFAEKGGEPYFQKCLQIVNNAQNESERGWKAFEGTKNRYWIVENLLNARFEDFRRVVYRYHRLGLDVMSNDLEGGRRTVFEALPDLKRIRQDQPNSFLLQVFFTSKADELVNIFSEGMPDQKARASQLLMEMDPSNSTKYQKIVKG
ncbi:MAG: DUF4835 family protein [Flavobacteriales bacterium]|nr:DUF4835 family protein [Flavobacteriales bacterium]